MTAHKPSHLVPKLRFPEFQRAGDWKRDQIGNVASITKGKRVSIADLAKGGATLCIRYAELYTHYREVIHEVVSRTNVPHEDLVLSQAEDVIVPASGETRVDIARAACVLPERVALGSDLNILRSGLYGPFFSYLLNSPLRHTIARMAQGDTVAHLYPKQLSQVWLAYPLRLEQQKIARLPRLAGRPDGGGGPKARSSAAAQTRADAAALPPGRRNATPPPLPRVSGHAGVACRTTWKVV